MVTVAHRIAESVFEIMIEQFSFVCVRIAPARVKKIAVFSCMFILFAVGKILLPLIFFFCARFRRQPPAHLWEDPLPLQPRPHKRRRGQAAAEGWSRFVGEAAAEGCPPRLGGPRLEAAADEDAARVLGISRERRPWLAAAEGWSRFAGEAAREGCPPRLGGPRLEVAADEDAAELRPRLCGR